jgi:hypothetical protein
MRFLITASNAAPVVVFTKLDAIRRALELNRQSRDVLITDEKGRQYGIRELDLFYFAEPPEGR